MKMVGKALDNAPGKYNEKWKHSGKCWDNNLLENTYDIVLTSHMLEHVPHFRLEKTISEFNRIMKIGGTLRILVPSLSKAAKAYVKGDKSFFSSSKHYSDHLGIGASFVRVLISPGQQTIAISREMDEIFGGYAHLYSFDFEMLKILLEKWGFGEIKESEPGKSKIKELRKIQCLISGDKQYKTSDNFVRKKSFLKSKNNWHYAGFDKSSSKQLIIEAKKIRNEKYYFDKEYEFNKGARFNSKVFNFKLKIFKVISKVIDVIYLTIKKIK